MISVMALKQLKSNYYKWFSRIAIGFALILLLLALTINVQSFYSNFVSYVSVGTDNLDVLVGNTSSLILVGNVNVEESTPVSSSTSTGINLAQIVIPVVAVAIIVGLVIAVLSGSLSLAIIMLFAIAIMIGLAFLYPIALGLSGL